MSRVPSQLLVGSHHVQCCVRVPRRRSSPSRTCNLGRWLIKQVSTAHNMACAPWRSQVPLTVDNLLLRGTTLRKTSWVIGLVVFAGADTKIMMNRTPAKRKVRAWVWEMGGAWSGRAWGA